MFERHRRSFFTPALAILIAATWLIYAPGLRGGFLFDDYANLPSLGSTGPVDNWATFWRYITSGIADPLGRPLAMLSFLLDARDWPAYPFPFKRTNLIVHLVNGALVAVLLRRLGRGLRLSEYLKNRTIFGSRVDLAAVLGAAFWLVHPLLVSTTLYVVQREAMLSTTFVLLGLLAWLTGRRALVDGHYATGVFWILLGLPGCTLLAILCKGNGILLPALTVVMECTALPAFNASAEASGARQKSKRLYLTALALIAMLPAAGVIAYLLFQAWSGLFLSIASVRPWTVGQRLLTEPRVLVDYLQLLWLPRPFTPGLFNDQIHASTSLWSPATTAPAIVTVLGLITGAWLCRRRYPACSLAVLFYFAGQSLESSSIPLELYFEHRNYLPAMLMFWPLALWLCGVNQSARDFALSTETEPSIRPAKTKPISSMKERSFPPDLATSQTRITARRLMKPALAIGLLLGLGIMTNALASLWGDTRDQTAVWAALNPDSPRAQAGVASDEMRTGHPILAAERLEQALAKAPTQVQLAMNLFDARCQIGHVDQKTIDKLAMAFRTTHDPGQLMVGWFEAKIDQVQRRPCPELTFSMLDSQLTAASVNQNLNRTYGRRQDISYLRGRIALIQGNANTALADFNLALDEDAQASVALHQAALLGSQGFPREGIAHLNHYDIVKKRAVNAAWGMGRVHAWVLQEQNYWPTELARLRDTLDKNAINQASAIHESCDSIEKKCAR